VKKITEFPTRHEASKAAAIMLAKAVNAQLAAKPRAALVVSGGRTPKVCFALLAQQPVEWGRVLVTLSDERCVAADHVGSNARMVRENLMVEAAAAATLCSPEMSLPEPFAAVLLGMGADGHFASLFPDANTLPEGLDRQQQANTITVQTAASPYARISMPMARLLRTECLLLLAFGDDKRAVIDAPGNTPIRQLFEQSQTPVQIYWAP